LPLSAFVHFAAARTRRLPEPLRYAIAAAGIIGTFLARRELDETWTQTFPLISYSASALAAALMLGVGPGLLSLYAGCALAAWFYFPPTGSLAIANTGHAWGLAIYATVGTAQAFVLETLVNAIEHLTASERGLKESERHRTLLLHEFRHRTRNDLQGLTGLLLLRARSAKAGDDPAEALREAAGHALALARVHSRLVAADLGDMAGAVIDTREFVHGLAEDIMRAGSGNGLRPVALHVTVESHSLPAERAVPLGLVLNECITNSLKYAFGIEEVGTLRVEFYREADDFVLTIADDGAGLSGAADGLGTRLLRALAAQLRGRFARTPATIEGSGTLNVMRFAVASPGFVSKELP
jgi:two-component sensor histidine kinase